MIVTENFKHTGVTKEIIGAFYTVYNSLGYGFLEKVYEKALFLELKSQGMYVTKQERLKVYYENEEVGEYFADMVVAECVIVELKATESICKEHETQLINYLKATGIEAGLLLNFGKKPEFKRKVFTHTKNPIKS